jgi:Mrp family chromosome partitioning ATPase
MMGWSIMDKCDNCASKGKCNSKGSCMVENNPLNNVKKIIGVMSGKGGVGKSTISALIAAELNRKGYKTGIMDADITGPSIPRFFKVADEKVTMDASGIYPVTTKDGIKVMSMNFLMEYEEQPVIWRGPIVSGTVKQFWTDVIWGELDYLVIDMPPGTGDVALTAMQSIPISGIVMVSTPQSMVSMIVAKAVNMAEKMNVNVLGVIENMSYMTCPECSKRIEIYGEGAAKAAAEKTGAKFLGELPLDKELLELTEEGRIELFGKIKEDFKYIVDNIISEL